VRAKKKDTGIVYALKIMDKKFITKENKTAYVKLERIVLDQLDHPGIVRLFFTFQDNYSLCRYLGSSLSKFLCFCSPCFIFFLLQPQWLWLVCLSGLSYDIDLFWFYCADMALESCEGGELFDQITRVSTY